MAKLLFFNIPATGHVNPTLPVMKELIARGEEVVYVNHEGMRSKIEPTGVRFIPYEAPFPDFQALNERVANSNLIGNALDLVRISKVIFPWVLELIEREQPDYIMFDSLANWGALAARKTGLPGLTSSSTLVVTRETTQSAGISALMQILVQFAGALPRYSLVALQTFVLYGVCPVWLPNALSVYSKRNIVYTSREFQPGGERFGDDFRFVGASISPRPDDSDFPFDQLTQSPVIYISLGTIANRQPKFYQICFEAFKDFAGQVVLSVGKDTDISSLGELPANFIVRNSVPQLEVLQRANAFVTHAGLNSIHEALYYGVPMVLIPQQFEQLFTANHVAKLGAGNVLTQELGGYIPQPGELRSAVEKVLNNDAYAQTAANYGQTLRDAGGAARAAEEIMAFGRGE